MFGVEGAMAERVQLIYGALRKSFLKSYGYLLSKWQGNKRYIAVKREKKDKGRY